MLPDYSNNRATPEELYREKHTWLLRWALHFCGKDRSAAEDLVQDVFMQMLVSWPAVAASAEPEKLLYTYLKYAFLMKCRRDRRFSFQTLSAIDFESVQLSLRRQKDAEPIEMQDGLRRILAYLNWRKLQAKCASILLLRFFHGFFPSEIMQIALQTRRSVDAGLAQAREEAKTYLADPKKLQFMHKGSAPQPTPVQSALPPDELIDSLRIAVFQQRPGRCLPETLLRQRYVTGSSTPIECDLLAHIVSCPRCLDHVCNWCKLTPLKDRSTEEAWSFASRDKTSALTVASSSARTMQQSLRGGEQRYRAAYEHRPKALLIAVDGQLLAARDVSSFKSELQVEVTAGALTEIIEVMSEQELPLLTVPVEMISAVHANSIHYESMLAGGQCLTLTIRYIDRGLSLELNYLDPTFDRSLGLSIQRGQAKPPFCPALQGSLWSRIQQSFGILHRTRILLRRQAEFFWRQRLVVLALLILGIMGAVRERRGQPTLSADALLNKVVSAQDATATSTEGVITQQLRISSSTGSTTLVLHKDVRGKRRAVTATVSDAQKSYARRLALSDISWDDPLSPANFRDWHDRAHGLNDAVRRTGKGQITLTSRINDPYLISESLTVREKDFHPVSRSIEFRDHELLEIAEVAYQVIPWSQVDSHWFEPSATISVQASLQPLHLRSLQKSTQLTEFQLDEAELEVKLGLNETNADARERLQLTRKADAIYVEGLVADNSRKQEIVSRLNRVKHAVVRIRTFAEFLQQTATPMEHSSIVVSQQQGGASSLERFIAARGGSAQEAGALAHSLFSESASVQQSARMLDDLDRRFRSRVLSEDAASALSQLRVKQLDRLKESVEKQIDVLASIGISTLNATSATSQHSEDLRAQALRNTQLCTELISQTAQSDRETAAILADLASSLSLLKFTAEQNDAEQARGSVLPSLDPNVHDH